MPFDEFFSSKPRKWSEHWQEVTQMQALHKRSWPTGGGFKPGHKANVGRKKSVDTEQMPCKGASRGPA